MCANKSNDFALTEEKLDELFVREVCSVAKMAIRLPPDTNNVAPICTRWFQIFERSPPKEKFARNCMLLLMHKQLNDRGALRFPFTDKRNWEGNLRSLHEMILRMGNSPRSMYENLCGGEDAVSSKSEDWCSADSISSSKDECGVSLYVRLEDANQQLVAENNKLSEELQVLKFQFDRLQQRRQSFDQIQRTLRDENLRYDKELSYLKDIFACAAITALKLLGATQSLTVKPQFFVTLYSVLCEEERGVALVESLDKQFEQLLQERINFYIRQQREPAMRQVAKQYDELRSKIRRRYKKLMKKQDEVQEKKLLLMAMRYLELLRKLFLESFKGADREKRAVVKFLNLCYKEVSGNM